VPKTYYFPEDDDFSEYTENARKRARNRSVQFILLILLIEPILVIVGIIAFNTAKIYGLIPSVIGIIFTNLFMFFIIWLDVIMFLYLNTFKIRLSENGLHIPSQKFFSPLNKNGIFLKFKNIKAIEWRISETLIFSFNMKNIDVTNISSLYEIFKREGYPFHGNTKIVSKTKDNILIEDKFQQYTLKTNKLNSDFSVHYLKEYKIILKKPINGENIYIISPNLIHQPNEFVDTLKAKRIWHEITF